MRRVAALSALLIAAGVGHAAPGVTVYTNLKYQYAVAYPRALLHALPEPDAGDGVTFRTRTRGVAFVVFGSTKDSNDTPQTLATQAARDCDGHRASYRVVKPRFFAISCVAAGSVLYEKTLIRDDDGTATLQARYPAGAAATWNPVVATMARSLTFIVVHYGAPVRVRP